MVYVAMKPCRFGGTDYLIGDTIPSDSVLPTQEKALQQMGVIAIGFVDLVEQIDEAWKASVEENSGNEDSADEPSDAAEEEHKPKRGRRKAE